MLCNNDLVIAYIKELLHNFNLPMVPVYTDSTVPYLGRTYIKEHKVVRYGKHGRTSELYDYVFDYPIVNLTKNFIIKSSVYDEYTHNYLGDYLRFIRDYVGLDLMGMYNCFNKQQPRKLKRREPLGDDQYFDIDTNNINYKYFLVPIKFNQYYTIGMSAGVPYEIALVIHNNQFLSNSGSRLIKASYKKVISSGLKQPFVYSTYVSDADGDIGEDLWKHEKYLRLLIKLPVFVDSSITVLEGN